LNASFPNGYRIDDAMVSIDIVVPCYQYGVFLADCVASIQRQGIEQLRILIIDNASSDDSVEVANRLASADRRIEVFARRKNLGPTASYNEGIDWARSDYMMIVDADDLVAAGCLASGVAFLERHRNISFAHGVELQQEFEAGVVPPVPCAVQANSWAITSGKQFIERTCRYPVNTVANSSVIVRTAAQKMAGYYNPRLPHSDDLEMWLRLARLGDVGSSSAVHGIRRIHSRQLTQGYARDAAALDYVARLAAFNSFFERPGVADAARLRRISRRSLSAKAYWSALSHAYRRRYRDARELLSFVWGQCPSMVVLPPIDWLLRIPGLFQRLQVVLSGTVR
jgi:glycosyltransferase involved in cell wall biosynthesis